MYGKENLSRLQKKVWVQGKGKSANGIHGAWAQKGGWEINPHDSLCPSPMEL